MATALYRIGRTAFRRRRLFLAVWLVLLVGTGVGAAALSGPTSNKFSIPGTESQKAIDLLQERLPQANGASGRIVFAAKPGQKLSEGDVKAALAKVGKAPDVVAVSDPFAAKLVSADGRIALAQVT